MMTSEKLGSRGASFGQSSEAGENPHSVESFRDAILSGAITPGSVFRLEDIVHFLGLSPMLSREAIRLLEAQGLVDFSPQTGVIITELSPEDIQELFDVRVALESLALRRSVPHMADASIELASIYLTEMQSAPKLGDYLHFHRLFHMALYQPGNSSRYLNMIMHEFDAAQRYLRFEKSEFDVWVEDQEEHLALIEACRAGDAEQAVKIIEPHISKTKYAILSRIQSAVSRK